MTRQDLLGTNFEQGVEPTLDDVDVIDLLMMLTDRCIDLVGVDAAGILLPDSHGTLRVMAASTRQARLLELFRLQHEEGPSLEAFLTGRRVMHVDLRSAGDRWPRFTDEAGVAGFGTVYALPLRVHSVVIGALNLFRVALDAMSEPHLAVAQSFADVASLALLQDQSLRSTRERADQLEHALRSRIAIEQAKGMLAERSHVDIDEAFRRLRNYARTNHLQLTSVAIDVVSGAVSLDDVDAGRRQIPR
jgi:transcriptional regulator with GAF, ATPase, and Fis domain